MKQTVKLGCRVLVTLLCLAMFASVITVPTLAATTPDISSLTGGDLNFLMGLLEQYNKVKGDEDAAEQMKEYVEEQYNKDDSFKESADSYLGNGNDDKTLDNMNSVIDNVFTDTFTITWVVNGITVAEQEYSYGVTPVYPGNTEELNFIGGNYNYVFRGWGPVVVPAKADATYVATFVAEELEPAGAVQVTFVTAKGTFVKSFDSEDDAQAYADSLDTAKDTDSNYSYTFAGWSVEDGVWTAQYNRTEVSKGWADILTSGKVIEDYFGSIDDVVDAVQNGASVDDLMDSIQYQQQVEQNRAEAEERGEEYVEPTYIVVWELDGTPVAKQEYTYKQLIKQPTVESMSAGKYVSWNMSYVLMPDQNITITGKTVDIVGKIVNDINKLPMNYGEYRMTYVNGVATLYVNVNATNYNEILADVLGDVRSGNTKSAYKSAIMAFLQSAAMEMYNSKTTTIKVNDYEVFGIEGYSATQLLDLLDTVQKGNYGEIVSVDGIKKALLSDVVTPDDLIHMGDDGVISTYKVTLGAEGKQDFDVQLNIALDGVEEDLDLIRQAAQKVKNVVDTMVNTVVGDTVEFAQGLNGDLDINIFIPGAFTQVMAEALNHAGVSDQTKQNIVSGLSECATVGELLELIDVLDYDQFVAVVDYLMDHSAALSAEEQAVVQKMEEIRPAFELFEKFGDILIDVTPESVSGKQASLTLKSVYNLTQAVTFDDLAALTQLKDADALVGSARLDAAAARVANKLNISPARAQAIVERMVEAFADFQNSIPESGKAEAAFNLVDRTIDLLFNQIPEKFQDAKLTDLYQGNGEFSFKFSKTYNPGAWLESILNNVTITAYGKSLTLGDLVPTFYLTANVSVNITIADLYSVTFVDENGNKLFEGFLPYGAELAPYCSGYQSEGHVQVMYNERGRVVTTMPAGDSVITVALEPIQYTVSFVDENGNVLFSDLVAWGTSPVYGGELPTKASDAYKHYAFKGWTANGVVYEGELPVVTGDVTYTVVFADADRYYTITFNMLGNTVEQQYLYGQIPAYDATIEGLHFKGWVGYGETLPEVKGDATYEAMYTAIITFLVNDEVYAQVEVPYGTSANAFVPETTPVKADKILGYEALTTFVFNAWVDAQTGAGLNVATKDATYKATFAAVETKYSENDTVTYDAINNRFNITAGELTKNGNRLSATAVIPAMILGFAKDGYGVEVQIIATENGQQIVASLDSAALLNIAQNAETASLFAARSVMAINQDGDVSLKISKLAGIEQPFDESTFKQYAAVYVFDLIGSALTDGNALDVVLPYATNVDQYHSYLYCVTADGIEQIEAAFADNKVAFSTDCNGYYAIKSEQYVFTVYFYDWNNPADYVAKVTYNKDRNELLNVPTFAPNAEFACVTAVWGTKLADGSFKQIPDSYANDLAAYFEDNIADSVFYAQVDRRADHNWGNWVVVEEATSCVDAGVHSHTCKTCGAVESEIYYTDHVDANGDNFCDICDDQICDHSLQHYPRVEPTCTTGGNKEYYYCSLCGNFYSDYEATVKFNSIEDTLIGALGHNYQIVNDGTQSSCTEIVVYNTKCTRCDATGTLTVRPTGHNYESVTTDPTCTEEGYTTHTCSKCGDSYVNSYVNALGHSFELVDHKDPTCTEKGYDKYSCTRCNDRQYDYIDEIPAAHQYVSVVTAPTCNRTYLYDYRLHHPHLLGLWLYVYGFCYR